MSASRTHSRRSDRRAGLGYLYLETDVHATRDGVLHRLSRRPTRSRHRRSWRRRRLVLRRDRDGADRRPAPRADDGGTARGPPEARFNIDLKSDGAVQPLVDLIKATESWDRVLVGSFSWPRLRRFRRLSEGRVATSAAPLEVAAFRLLPERLAGRSGHRETTSGPADPGQEAVDHARRRPVSYAARTPPASRFTSGPSMIPRRCACSLDRGVDGLISDQTDVLKTVLGERQSVEGSRMSHEPAGIADLAPLIRAQRPAGLVLVRLGQQRLLHHRRDRAVRAVHHQHCRERRGQRPDQRAGDLRRARARCRSTS